MKIDSFESHVRHVRIAVNEEAPGLIFVFPGIINSDARAREDWSRMDFPVFDPNRSAEEICAVELLIDRHRHAQLAGATGDIGIALWIISKCPHQIYIFERLESANENRCRITQRFRHNVQAKVKTVDHVDIRIARRPKHHRGPGGMSLRSVAGEIVRSYIGLGLNNLAGELAPVQSSNENFAQQIGSDI